GEDRSNQAVIHGYIDRVEAYPPAAGEHSHARGRGWERMSSGPEGPVVVVDLKTGKNDPESDSGVAEHAQLAAYQVAV
ncbi:PD-(D/E)XK nuclease family protein, partial [Paraburkholderia sp. SIMBA_053]